MNRDLDAEILERIFGWILIPVSADANGENACEVLFYPDIKPTQEYYNRLPLKGKPHKAFFGPNYSSDLKTALKLAKRVNLPLTVEEISLDPETIAKGCLDYYTNINGL